MISLFTLSDTDFEKMSYDRYYNPCPMIRMRLHVLVAKHITQRTNKVISKEFGVNINFVSNWINVYLDKGIDAIYTNKYGTNKSKLEDHTDILTKYFDENPPKSIKETRAKIIELTDITRCPTQVRAFLKRHDFRLLKAGQIPAKANTTDQVNWVENKLKPTLEEAKSGEHAVLFMDAAHFVLLPHLCYLWYRARVYIQGSAGRNRINVLGAVDAVTKNVHTLINTTYVSANTVMEFLLQLRQTYENMPLTIILDNARYQQCQAVKDMAEKLKIELLFLPSYSPNLNTIERLWKQTKKELLYAKYYETPDKFHNAIRNYFSNINNSEKETLNKLLSLKFQYFDRDQIISFDA
jgi:transposase